MLLQFRRRDRRRLQASFRRGTSYPFWRLGFRQSSFRHITRIFPARRPVRLGTAAGFLACYFPPVILSDRSKPSDPGIPPPIPARCASDTTLRLVAQ